MSRTGLGVLMVTLGVTAVLAAGPVEAAPPLRTIATTAVSPATSDGSRFVVVPLAAPRIGLDPLQPQSRGRAAVRILDTVRDRWRRVSGPRGFCTPTRPGGGQLLWDCRQPLAPFSRLTSGRLHRLDLRTGHTHRIAGILRLAARFPEASGFSFDGIGSRWISGQRIGPGPTQPFFFSWRNGQVSQQATDPTSAVDLDASTPVVRVCPGLRLDNSALPYLDQYDRPYELAFHLTGVPARPAMPFPPADLLLYRCGHRRAVHLARCRCQPPTLAAGIVTWVQGTVVHAFLARSGRHLRWRVTRRFVSVVHTTDRVVVSIPPRQMTGRWQILSAPI